MGFDQNEIQPLIEPSKKTTKVNMVIVVAVLVFLAFGACAMYWMKIHYGDH